MNNYIILKRPVITIFVFYAVFLIFLDTAGVFLPYKQSFLYHFAAYNKPVTIEGKVISSPESVKNGQRFILQANMINDFYVREKILINSPSGYKISYGDIINVKGRILKPKKADFPLVFDYSRYLARLGIYTSLRVQSFEYIESKPNLIKKFALVFRQDIVKKIDIYFKKACADILKPIVIGDKMSLEAQVKEDFIDAGLMHVLVVSGLHVSFIGAILLAIFKLLGLSLRKASLLSIPFIFLYVTATGANPPALRAGIMFSSVLLSLSLDREPLIYNSLALSALLILIFQPQQLFTASFHMSYLATIGIIYFYGDISRIFGNIKNVVLKFLCGVFSVTLSAQMLLIPICMYYFGKISLISFAANIIMVPLIGIVMPLGFLFYFFTFISSYASHVISFIISIILHFILITTHFSANLAFSKVMAAKPSVLQLTLLFLFLFFATYFKDKKRFIVPAFCLILSLFYIAVPKFIAKEKLIFNVYDGYNITTIQIISKGIDTFILYQKSDKYDKYYMDSFLQFLFFSGIKNTEISFIGFNESNVLNHIKNGTLTFIRSKKPEILNMDFYGNKISFDMREKQIFVNGALNMKIEDNPSFYYYFPNKEFKIKK
ncbi:MAG: ComEC family competence protein [Endomicrobium sp.]|jgi:competence protein ComEC|nr:ComEC family competence protein [Endomicrobium sp.]